MKLIIQSILTITSFVCLALLTQGMFHAATILAYIFIPLAVGAGMIFGKRV